MTGKREEEEKKTFVNNPTTIHPRAPYHVEEGMMMHQKRQQKFRFGHWVASHTRHLNDTDITHSLAHAEHTLLLFFI